MLDPMGKNENIFLNNFTWNQETSVLSLPVFLNAFCCPVKQCKAAKKKREKNREEGRRDAVESESGSFSTPLPMTPFLFKYIWVVH